MLTQPQDLCHLSETSLRYFSQLQNLMYTDIIMLTTADLKNNKCFITKRFFILSAGPNVFFAVRISLINSDCQTTSTFNHCFFYKTSFIWRKFDILFFFIDIKSNVENHIKLQSAADCRTQPPNENGRNQNRVTQFNNQSTKPKYHASSKTNTDSSSHLMSCAWRRHVLGLVLVN